MKIIVISDVHGNLPALEVVLQEVERRAPDMLVVNGDLINRGPNSLACLELLRQRRGITHYVRGNHEAFTLQAHQEGMDKTDNFHTLRQFAHWTAKQLGEDALHYISTWQAHIDADRLDGGSSFHITHGSVLGDRDGISASTRDDMLAAKLGEPRALFVASHTHKAMQKMYQGRLIVNTGSVGQPLDEDERASFAEFTHTAAGWQVDQIRLQYDRPRALSDYLSSGFIHQAGPMPLLIYCEHRLSRMCVGPMMHQYYELIESGALSLHVAVEEYLKSTGLLQKLKDWKVDSGSLYI